MTLTTYLKRYLVYSYSTNITVNLFNLIHKIKRHLKIIKFFR